MEETIDKNVMEETMLSLDGAALRASPKGTLTPPKGGRGSRARPRAHADRGPMH
jgi:hypothetical protein